MTTTAAPAAGLLTHIPALDTVLRAYVAELGADFTAYRNHA